MTDSKIATLYDNYQQYASVQHLSEKTEKMKQRAVLLGAGTSMAIFFANEVSRFTLRSPFFRLKPLPVFLVLVTPTALLKYGAKERIESEVMKFWNIHKFREDNGLGGSYKTTGVYPNRIQDTFMYLNYPLDYTPSEVVLGTIKTYLGNTPSIKTPKDVVEYPAFHEDYDRDVVYNEFEKMERLEMFSPKKGSTKGHWFAQSPEDTDTKVQWGGVDNDNPVHEPPDSGFGPLVDHKLADRIIFRFARNQLNQEVINNIWKINPNEAILDTNMPWWGQKLCTPHFYNDEDYFEALHQRVSRKEFSILKAKWSLRPETPGNKRKEAEEAKKFIDRVYDEKLLRDLKDVYVTDHSPNPKRLHTNSEDEDLDFFNYEQKLKEFHSSTPTLNTVEYKDGDKWEHPIFKILDIETHAGEDGVVECEVTDDELNLTTDHLKSRYEFYQQAAEVVSEQPEDDDDDEELPPFHERVHSDEAGFFKDLSKYNEFLYKVNSDRIEELVENLGPIKEGEEYTVAKDIQDAYRRANGRSLVDLLLDKIPEHAYWDIKTPQLPEENIIVSEFSPVKPKTSNTFWEYRNNSRWLEDKHRHPNLRASISTWTKY